MNKEEFLNGNGTEKVQKLYDKLNREHFNNELPKYKIVLIKRKNAANMATVYLEKKRLELSVKNHMKKKLCLTGHWYKEIIDSLKHEMIHIWQYHIISHEIYNAWKCGHNKLFKAKANEIGVKLNWD